MLLSLVLSVSALKPADYVIELCTRAHKALDKASVEIHVNTVGALTSEASDYVLSYVRPDSADLTIKRKHPFRIVVTKDQLIEFDAASKQFAEKTRFDQPLADIVKHSAGVLDELVASLLEPDGVQHWLSALKKSQNWSFGSGSSGLTIQTRTSEGTISMVVDRESNLLRSVSMKTDRFGTDWAFSYRSAPSSIAFVPPPGAYKTSDIRPEIGAPTYSSADAKHMTEKVFAKYDNVSNLAYAVQSGSETTEVWVSNGKMRQRDAWTDWTLAGGKLSLLNLRQHEQVKGEATLGKTVDAVAKAGSRFEPLLKLIARGINPFRLYLGKNANVAVTGRTRVGNVDCTLLEAKCLEYGLSMIVRNSDGFVLSLGMTSERGADDMTVQSRTYKEMRTGSGFVPTLVRTDWPTIDLKSYLPNPGP